MELGRVGAVQRYGSFRMKSQGAGSRVRGESKVGRNKEEGDLGVWQIKRDGW